MCIGHQGMLIYWNGKVKIFVFSNKGFCFCISQMWRNTIFVVWEACHDAMSCHEFEMNGLACPKTELEGVQVRSDCKIL